MWVVHMQRWFSPGAALEDLGLPQWRPGVEMVQLLGSQGLWQLTQGNWRLGQQEIQCSRRVWQPTPVFLPGEAHWQRSLAGHSLQGHRELNMTEATTYTEMQGFFLPVAVLPQWGLSVNVVQLLGWWGPWCAKCARTSTASAAGVVILSKSFFEPL